MGEPRHILGDELQLLQARRIGFEERMFKASDSAESNRSLSPRKFGDVDLNFSQCEQHRRGHGTLIVLDLIEIARRNSDASANCPCVSRLPSLRS